MSCHPTITDSTRIKGKIDRYTEQTNRAIEKLRSQEADIDAKKIAVQKAKGTDNADTSWMQQQAQAMDALQQQFVKDKAKVDAAQKERAGCSALSQEHGEKARRRGGGVAVDGLGPHGKSREGV